MRSHLWICEWRTGKIALLDVFKMVDAVDNVAKKIACLTDE